MNTKFKLTLYCSAISIVLSGTMLLSSCQKKDPVEKPPVEQGVVVSIADLKSFMAELVNVKMEDIIYNEATETFSMFGVDQVTRKELTKFYFNLKK